MVSHFYTELANNKHELSIVSPKFPSPKFPRNQATEAGGPPLLEFWLSMKNEEAD